MKILNRPMFRYGGPIKEGIMDGIQEPKRGRVDGPGSYGGDEAKIFANVEKEYIPNVKSDQYYKEQANIRNKPINEFFTDSFIRDEINKKNLIGKYDPENDGVTSLVPFSKSNKMPYIGNDGLSYTDRFVEDYKLDKRSDILANEQEYFENYKEKNYGDKIELQKNLLKKYDPNDPRLKLFDTKRLRGTSGAPGGGDPEMYAKPNTVEKVLDNTGLDDGTGKEDPEANRKKSINNILEKLGYARSQKNALYDALIAGGQRISREGLGKTNLVNDLIADTSTAYDKPEKIREAAELMQVQQDLKLEGIDRSKDNRGPVQKTVEYFMSKDGGDHSREDALALAKNQAIDAYGIFTEAKAKGTTTEAVDFTASKMADAGRFGEGNVYKNRIDTKYKGSSGLIEFMESGNYNGDGVYTRGGEILLLKDGKVTSLVRFKGTGKTGFFGGEKE